MYVEVIACHISVTFSDTVWNWNARAFRYNFLYVHALKWTIYTDQRRHFALLQLLAYFCQKNFV